MGEKNKSKEKQTKGTQDKNNKKANKQAKTLLALWQHVTEFLDNLHFNSVKRLSFILST